MGQSSRRVTCIVCPLSCLGEVEIQGDKIGAKGYSCKRGVTYATEEVTAPKRVLTTTVKVVGGELPLLPVVSKQPLPKDSIIKCARHLSRISVTAPVREGEVICHDLLGYGVDIVASRSIKALANN